MNTDEAIEALAALYAALRKASQNLMEAALAANEVRQMLERLKEKDSNPEAKL